jgi:hypothetical protein
VDSLGQLSDNKHVTALGPGPNDHLRGKRAIARAWTRKRGAPPSLRFVGDVRADLTPDGALAWVVGNASSADAAVPSSHRVMLVYARDAEASRLVARQVTGAFR